MPLSLTYIKIQKEEDRKSRWSHISFRVHFLSTGTEKYQNVLSTSQNETPRQLDVLLCIVLQMEYFKARCGFDIS
uniref:Uncharacterized protein n=1 Tax=Arundo donax TaxID=35708 RepID=A0A0A9DUZ4_ARUDO